MRPSARAASAVSTRRAAGFFRSSVTLFLLRLKLWKKWLSPFSTKYGPTRRAMSPPSAGFSILITSAPRSASCIEP
jgi:hypothetical protein